MTEPGKIKIIIPKFARSTREHLEDAGWKPVFDYGGREPADYDAQRTELDRGTIEETGDPIIRIRSHQIPRQINMGYGDVGLVGSDCLAARANRHIVTLHSFGYGRQREQQIPQSRVEIVARGESPVSSIDKVKPGMIFLAEPQHLRLIKQHLEKNGFKVKREGYNVGPEFHAELRESGAVGISQIEGSGPVFLDDDTTLLVMVNESGQTVEDYNLKIVQKIYDIETLLITNNKALEDETKRERMMGLKADLEREYERPRRETETSSNREREPF